MSLILQGIIASQRKAKGSSGPSPHLYWRIYCTDNYIGSGITDSYSATAIVMRTFSGGANVASGGTPTAMSTYSGYPISNAFDDNAGTFWSGDHESDPPGGIGWVAYAFPTPVIINEIAWTARNDSFSTQSVKSGIVQYSDNGVDWTDAWAFENDTAYGAGGTHTFTNPET